MGVGGNHRKCTVGGPSQGGRSWLGGRCASQSFIASSKGAVMAVSERRGKLTSVAFRLLTPRVFFVDGAIRIETALPVSEIVAAVRAEDDGPTKGILGFPMVSLTRRRLTLLLPWLQPREVSPLRWPRETSTTR